MHFLSRRSLGRRTFLRGAGALVAVPVLDAMLNNHGTAYAQGLPLPKRFGVFFWGNGVRLDRWVPGNDGFGFGLSEELAPFAPVYSYLNIPTGFDVYAEGPRGHHGGEAGMLSGVEFIPIDANGANYASKFGGPSIDQMLASELHANKPVTVLGVSDNVIYGEGPTLGYISHRGPEEPIPAERDPSRVFAQMFGSFDNTDAQDPKNRLRASVLDAVRDDVSRLKNRLGARDRQRLDAHLTGISELRQRILALAPEFSGACRLPDVPPSFVVGGGDDLRRCSDLMADMIAMGFACDLTRSASLQFTGSVGYTVFPGQSAGIHDLTHDAADVAQNNVHSTVLYTMECFSSLLQKMQAMPEGDTNVLHNSLWMGTSDLSEGFTHSSVNYPVVLAGAAGGALRTGGQHVRGNGRNTNDILMTVLRAMGSGRTSIGAGGDASSTAIDQMLT
jgi:hypothetical protein